MDPTSGDDSSLVTCLSIPTGLGGNSGRHNWVQEYYKMFGDGCCYLSNCERQGNLLNRKKTDFSLLNGNFIAGDVFVICFNLYKM